MSTTLDLALRKAIEKPCAHCAISLFMNEWDKLHPEVKGPETLRRIVEFLADFIHSAPEDLHEETVIEASAMMVRFCGEILAGTYKSDNESSSGGLH